MAQQFKVIVNTGKDQAAQTLQAEQGAGQRGRPLIIKLAPNTTWSTPQNPTTALRTTSKPSAWANTCT